MVILATINLSSVNAFNLAASKILSFGKKLWSAKSLSLGSLKFVVLEMADVSVEGWMTNTSIGEKIEIFTNVTIFLRFSMVGK